MTTDFGDYRVWVTPVPIPNTEVKPDSADGTWVDSPWESRSSPDFSGEGPRFGGGPLLVFDRFDALRSEPPLRGRPVAAG